MSMKFKHSILAAALGTILLGAGPAMAESHGGGHGGGGHVGGGAHAAVGGGAHFGGAAHYSGGAHYASAGHYAGSYPASSHGYPAGFHGSTIAGYHGGYSHAGAAYYGHGYSTGAYWRGGYWHGGFWPRAYYGGGFSWFLPILPLAYATYWWDGVPYYYANDVYYTYNPSYDGYVATDPPPAADTSAPADASGAPPAAAPSAAPAPPPGAGGAVAGQVFMYPKNGQSPEQQATDKAECQQWAAQQAGQVAQNASDYQRAMSACVEGRGYSAR
jgi:hypothetical protein